MTRWRWWGRKQNKMLFVLLEYPHKCWVRRCCGHQHQIWSPYHKHTLPPIKRKWFQRSLSTLPRYFPQFLWPVISLLISYFCLSCSLANIHISIIFLYISISYSYLYLNKNVMFSIVDQIHKYFTLSSKNRFLKCFQGVCFSFGLWSCCAVSTVSNVAVVRCRCFRWIISR